MKNMVAIDYKRIEVAGCMGTLLWKTRVWGVPHSDFLVSIDHFNIATGNKAPEVLSLLPLFVPLPCWYLATKKVGKD
jgi:hypothetical protein